LKTLGQEGITAGEALSAAATGLGSLGMSVSGFA
jgi:hypothetical protein